jgi:chemotaxis signal transduction protein
MTETAGVFVTARELRDAFDRAFAAAPRPVSESFEDLLAIRVAGEPCAVRSAEIAGLFADRKVVVVPSAVRELLGIAGFRGSLVPVYDLAALLGYPPSGTCRWILLAGKVDFVGFAVGEFAGQARISACAADGENAVNSPRALAPGTVLVGDVVHRLINVASVVEAIRQRAGSSLPQGAIIHEP